MVIEFAFCSYKSFFLNLKFTYGRAEYSLIAMPLDLLVLVLITYQLAYCLEGMDNVHFSLFLL